MKKRKKKINTINFKNLKVIYINQKEVKNMIFKYTKEINELFTLFDQYFF